MAKAKKKESLSLEEKMERALVPVEQQPYAVPENWCWVKLDGLVSIVTGKKDANYGSENGEYAFFTCAGEPIRCDGYSFDGESLLLPGNGANVGQVFYYNGRFEAYQRTYVLQSISDNINLKYLYYQIQGFWEEYNKDKQYGSATNYIKMGNFLNYDVPVAPLAEQQRIVERIERLFVKLDEAKEKAEYVVETFQLHQDAILHKAFNGEYTEMWRTENQVSKESWRKVKLEELLKPMQSRQPQGESFRYIDIDAIDNKRQVIREVKVVLTSEAPSRASRAVEEGAILFSMVRPYLKNIAYVDKEMADCIASTGLYVCRCKESLDSHFLYEFLRSKDAIDYLMQFMKGDNSPSIRKDDLLGMVINLPSNEEQQQIVSLLNDLLLKEEQAKDKAFEVIENIELMKKSILAKAFRGELGTNNLEEENAVKLLNSILEAE